MKNDCECGGNCHCKKHQENTKMVDYFVWFMGACFIIIFLVNILR